MSANEIHVGDAGIVFTMTIRDQAGAVVDISNMTTKTFYLLTPGTGSITSISASFISGSGTAGVMGFTSAASHFTVMGKYKLQGYVANTGSTTVFHTDTYEFSVSSNIQ